MFGTFPRRKSDSMLYPPQMHYAAAPVEGAATFRGYQPAGGLADPRMYQMAPLQPQFAGAGSFTPQSQTHTQPLDWPYANARMWQHPQMPAFPHEVIDDDVQTYHPLLATKDLRPISNHASDILFYDVRYKDAFNANHKRLSDTVLSAPAFEPAITKIRLYSKDLPWVITVRNTDAEGITVKDILHAVYAELQHPIGEAEYWISSENDQKRMVKAYETSMAAKIGPAVNPRNKDAGVKRVDYLGIKTQFAGIRPVGPKDEEFVKKRTMGNEKALEEAWVLKFRETEYE